MAMPDPSSFDKLLTLQTKPHKSNNMGGNAGTWADTSTLWANIKPLSASQQFFAQQNEMRVTHEITTRFRPDITLTSAQRLVWQSRYFYIRGVLNIDEKRCFLKLSCEEGAAS